MSGTLEKIDRIIESKKRISFRKYNRIIRDLSYLDKVPVAQWIEINKKLDYIRKNLTESRKERLSGKNVIEPQSRKKRQVAKYGETEHAQPAKKKVSINLSTIEGKKYA